MGAKKQGCVLFSPIGMTDPVKGGRDGAMLHILRYYHPESVVLFLTKEMVAFHRKDDRYRRMAQVVQPEVELTVLEHEEIEKANEFECFDKLFRQALEDLHSQYPNHQILVNISSGTPQMEASLYLLSATLPFPVTPVQVSTPAKGSNYGKDGTVQNFTTVEDALDTWQETGSEEENRTKVLHLENVQAAILRANVQALIERYDYQAALTLIQSAPELFTSKAKTLCDAALQRVTLHTDQSRGLLEQAGCPAEEMFSLSGDPLEHIYEYILMLDTLLERKAFGDYARAISPAITEIMEQLVSFHLKQDVHELCRWENDKWVLSTEKIQAKDPNLLKYLTRNRPVEGSPLNSAFLLSILSYLSKRKSHDSLGTLRDFEKNVRNLAAHQIKAVDEDMIQSLCNRSHTTVVDIQKTLHQQFSTVCSAEAKSQLAKQKWNEKPFINQSGAYRCMDQNGDYRRMNRRIEEELNRVP